MLMICFTTISFGQNPIKTDESRIKELIIESFDEIWSKLNSKNIDKYYTKDFLLLENGEVWVESKPEAEVWQGENRVEKLKIYSPGNAPLVLRHGSLRWFVIKRGEKYGIRLRDLEHPNLSHFTGIESYAIDAKWRVEAKLEKFPEEKKIAITDVLGQTSMQPSSGALVFTLKGKTYHLDPIDEGDQFFILFGDKTNTKHTYQSGRFLYAKKPVAGSNTVILDFNKAYNPPCAFTEFATCPLPPAQNVLNVAIQAGEKRYHNRL